MPQLIKNGAVADNTWERVTMETAADSVLGADTGAQVIVPLAMWMAEKDSLTASDKSIGVWLDSEDDPYELGDEAANLPLIALDFPVFRDGRPFSTAAILRERLDFKGELRAVGDVHRDQLFYMQRCGFDSFELAEGEDVATALSAFTDFTTNYQSTVTEPTPLFRHRQA